VRISAKWVSSVIIARFSDKHLGKDMILGSNHALFMDGINIVPSFSQKLGNFNW
jgi:hypothetical protein